jgi:uncharacterized membrane protein SirB2
MLIKIIHMTAGLLVVILFYTQAIMVLRARGQVHTLRTSHVPQIVGFARFLKILAHIATAVTILVGGYLFLKLPGIYHYWSLTKIVLFGLAIIFSTMAFRGEGSRRAQNIGLFGAAICYAAIITLLIVKPWGVIVTDPVSQPVPNNSYSSGMHLDNAARDKAQSR